jgi:predicted exporter
MRYLLKIDSFLRNHKRMVAGILGALILVSLLGLKFVRYNNNIESMLPMDEAVQQAMRFLRESNFSDKLVISLRLNDPAYTTDDLILAADRLAASISSPLVKQVTSGINSGNFLPEMIFFLQYLGQLTPPASLEDLKNQLTPEGLTERLAFIYRQSLTPQSSFLMPFLRADPFNLSAPLLSNIEKLSRASGYDVTVNRGHFLSPDGRSAMIIVKTSVLLTEGFGSRKIIDYLQSKLRDVAGYINADIIAGHMHTVANEDTIKKDIRLTAGIAALGFIFLFLFLFNDWRALIIFAMPLGAVLITTLVTFFIFGSLSYFVIGLSTVIAGITLDYGIYVYIAVRKAGNQLATLDKIRQPMIFGALTTVSVFIVFFFSSVAGYHQLAFFSNFTIMLCLLFALFILPHFIKQEPALAKPTQKDPPPIPHSKTADYSLIGGWLVLMVIALILSCGLRFNSDITQFDAVTPQVLKSEEEFRKNWGNHKLPAVLVVQAPNLQSAYEINDRLSRQAAAAIGQENFTSLAYLWPAEADRRKNLAAWVKFWQPPQVNRLKELISVSGPLYNFSDDAFAPFYRILENPAPVEIEPSGLAFFTQLKEQFLLKNGAHYQVLSYFPDDEQFIEKLRLIKENFPGSFLVSRKSFSRQIAQALTGEFLFLITLAILATAGLTGLLLKSLRLMALASVPVITALALTGGITRLAGLSLNIPSIIAAMVVIGLVSDYGIFMVYYCKYKYETGTITAVTLAALTTLIGAGVLLFARHPVLFSVGVVMTSGVLFGYLSSLLVIPVLYRVWNNKNAPPI